MTSIYNQHENLYRDRTYKTQPLQNYTPQELHWCDEYEADMIGEAAKIAGKKLKPREEYRRLPSERAAERKTVAAVAAQLGEFTIGDVAVKAGLSKGSTQWALTDLRRMGLVDIAAKKYGGTIWRAFNAN